MIKLINNQQIKYAFYYVIFVFKQTFSFLHYFYEEIHYNGNNFQIA